MERLDRGPLECGWSRRSAKTLTKLLATIPSHALHREQVMEILWPDVGPRSALNSLGKALHAARHALEPELPHRSSSSYLTLNDSMVALDTTYVAIDADRFERLAEQALRGGAIADYGSALAIYAGDLLPEDRYEDWSADRRDILSELRIRLLLGLADGLEADGACGAAADRLREALTHDPTREEVHRRLMRLWAEIGCRDRAIRQFHICDEVLRHELGVAPTQETVSLYQDVLCNRVVVRSTTVDRRAVGPSRSRPDVAGESPAFVGRRRELDLLCGRLTRTGDDQRRMVVLSGEAGVGKTRLIEVLADHAGELGATVLWGGVGTHVSHLPYGPLAVALEEFLARRPEAERHELAGRYPALARLVPSLLTDSQPAAHESHIDLGLALVRLLSDLARSRPLLVVVGDLDDADQLSLDALRYFAHLARQRRWLLIGAVRQEALRATSPLTRMLGLMVRERMCMNVELASLSRAESDELVRTLSSGTQVENAGLEQIYAGSRGNPLFIEELVASERGSGQPRRVTGTGTWSLDLRAPVPERVRSLVAAQMTMVNETVRRVLTLAAADGAAEIPLRRLLDATAALEPPVTTAALFDSLDRALDLHILEETEQGYAFRHPLVRAALYQQLSRHRREQLRLAFHCAAGERSPVRVRAAG